MITEFLQILLAIVAIALSVRSARRAARQIKQKRTATKLTCASLLFFLIGSAFGIAQIDNVPTLFAGFGVNIFGLSEPLFQRDLTTQSYLLYFGDQTLRGGFADFFETFDISLTDATHNPASPYAVFIFLYRIAVSVFIWAPLLVYIGGRIRTQVPSES